MVKHTTSELLEGFSLAGTFLFAQKADAECVSEVLGITGAFPMQTDEGLYWMPGQSYDELMERIYSDWMLPTSNSNPQAHPHTRLTFIAFLDTEGRA